jgi:hypothetical protein
VLGHVLIWGVLVVLPVVFVATLVVVAITNRRSDAGGRRVHRIAFIAFVVEFVIVLLALYWISVDPGWTF